MSYLDILNEKVLSDVATTGAGSAVVTSDKNYLTWCVFATSCSATTTAEGATFTFQGSPDATKWGSLNSVTSGGTTAATQTITVDGTYFFNVPTPWTAKEMRPNITTYLHGNFTVWLMGKRNL